MARIIIALALVAIIGAAFAAEEAKTKDDLAASSSVGFGYGGLYGHGLYGHGLYGHGLGLGYAKFSPYGYGLGYKGFGYPGAFGYGYGKFGFYG